jgi:hypothetical protein
MQAKVLYSIILIGLICAGAGCLSPNSRPEFPAASSNTAGNHDAVLERFVAADYNATALNVSISSWQVKWVNSTALIINAAGKQAGTNNNVSISKTVKRFASMNDAPTISAIMPKYQTAMRLRRFTRKQSGRMPLYLEPTRRRLEALQA